VNRTRLGTHLRFTADNGLQFEVDIMLWLNDTASDPDGAGWIALVDGYHVYPDRGAFWPSVDEAIDAAETWIRDRHP
jgi:hypothetical protein